MRGRCPTDQPHVLILHTASQTCRGLTLDNTGQIPVDASKLLNWLGYWRGDVTS